jgi:hypothetical protein
VRPASSAQEGFPILVPVAFNERLLSRLELHGHQAVEALAAAGAPYRVLELGDPGIAFDIATPRASLPGYQGPPQPVDGPSSEWNSELAAAAARSDQAR